MSAYPPPLARRYTAAMTTPILIAAAARQPRRNPRAVQWPGGEGGRKKRLDNYRAQEAKTLAGAPLGNRNAVRRDPALVDRQARIDALIRRMSILADALLAAAHEKRLLAALLRAEAPDV